MMPSGASTPPAAPDAAARWNERYRRQPDGRADPPPQPWLLEQQGWLPRGGRALDVAMGLGGSAGWLLGRGLSVFGVDISEVAVRRAKARWPGLLAFVADLETLVLPAAAFDVILNFYYLDRALWPQYRRALRPGGVLFFETFTAGQPGMNPAYLMAPGELRAAFAGWRVLTYSEGSMSHAGEEPRFVASLVARMEKDS
jgi:tellurite methyltransferase